MEKNVGSVDLEELKRAREALNQERGIETDPNEYANYNPNRNKEESVSEPFVEEQSSESSVSVDDVLSFGEELNETQENSGEETDILSVIEDLAGFNENQANEQEGSNVDAEFNLNLEQNENEDSQIQSLTEESDNNSSSVASDDYAGSDINFDVYDKFADFEIKNEFAGRTSSANAFNSQSFDAREESAETSFISEEKQDYERNEEAEAENVAESVFNISEENTATQQNEAEDGFAGANPNTKITTNENGDTIINFEVEYDEPENVEIENINIENNEFSSVFETNINTQAEEPEEVKTEISETYADIDTSFDDALKQGKLGELLSQEETDKVQEELGETSNGNAGVEKVISSEPEDEPEILTSDRQAEILNAISVIRPVSTQKTAEVQEVEETPSDDDIYKVEVIPFNTIEEYDFLEVIGSRVFKSGNQLSYLIGKDEEGELVFDNLKTMHNTAIFGSNEKQIASHISAMILSLMIKNSSEDFKFAICDPSLRSGYDVFEGSSYMWFNSVKKSEDDIFETLDKIVTELEERYQNFARINVKSISEFNEAVEPEYQMPHILFVFGNYSNIYHYSNSDEINASLYAILKLGKLVGIHAIITSSEVIENSNINFNLPTRVVFKLDNNEDAGAMLGESGAERLSVADELLHFAVSEDEPIHLKSAKLKTSEIRLILQNIEN